MEKVKPFFQMENILLYLGDCLTILDELEIGSVDMVCTDPPWGISREVIIHRSSNPQKYKYVGKDISLDFGEWDHFEDLETYLAFTNEWVPKTIRLLKRGGHWVSFFDIMKVSYLIELGRELDCQPRQILAWRKTNPVPRGRCVDFMVALEHAIWLTKETKARAESTFNWELGQQQTCIEAPIPGHTTSSDGERSHPTQKPVSVLKVWISYLSKPGDTILDPFCGSGSTLIAALELGRKAIGIEIDEDYCRSAVARLKRATRPLPLDL